MTNKIELPGITLYNDDCINVLKSLPDNSVDLIVTDPPYFRVKSEKWDRQWTDNVEFLAWLDDVLAEFWRVLKPAGSLYLFCGWALASDTEILLRQRMKILNHIIWAKPHGRWNGANKEGFRQYFPSTERILFAEHYGAEGYAKGAVGYGVKCQELKRNVFAPLIEYFRNARQALNVSTAEINAATGCQMSSHWFSASQWRLPSEEQYQKLQTLFAWKAAGQQRYNPLSMPLNVLQRDYVGLTETYTGLVAQYNDLRQQYRNLRRPFSVTRDTPHTDTWTFAPVAWRPGKHPCEKPAVMMEHIIQSSSRPGNVVADFFMGSGSTIKAAKRLGRHAIGVELETERFEQTVKEVCEYK
ncbi:site-specific DNA-methyltransferase [Salmonella enterica subsp. enterica serovar Omuna]|nr:site-specific DNA-methyltransferase [Salmonella enterica subsp. enterica serovar Omuna]